MVGGEESRRTRSAARRGVESVDQFVQGLGVAGIERLLSRGGVGHELADSAEGLDVVGDSIHSSPAGSWQYSSFGKVQANRIKEDLASGAGLEYNF